MLGVLIRSLELAKTDEVACGRAERHQTEDIAPFLVLDTVTVLCMLVRLIGRYKIAKTIGPDDWIVFAILLTLLPFIVLGNYGQFIMLPLRSHSWSIY